MGGFYIQISSGAYWRTYSQGTTLNKAEAHIYTLEEIERWGIKESRTKRFIPVPDLDKFEIC